jgi:hypothetical protein
MPDSLFLQKEATAADRSGGFAGQYRIYFGCDRRTGTDRFTGGYIYSGYFVVQ